MLHEILLSLSGHPSVLFDAPKPADDDQLEFPLLSPQERALLSSVGRLSRLHRQVRDHAATISASHPSIICRAVATSITTVHLARFQQTILDVEAKILKKDASSVGAYNIVPLAGVVGEFDEWTRLMGWYWELACFIQPVKSLKGTTCTGSGLIDKLRQEAQTGYPDIEEASLSLGKVAETAWLRQLSTWVLYGRLPAFGTQDFFLKQIEGPSVAPEYEMTTSLLPKFVTPDTASSILFIGKSLNHIRVKGVSQDAENVRKAGSELDLLPTHLRYLSQLALPISSAALANAIASIRLSLSRNTLQQLLPLPKIIQLLSLLREFFLLGRGEFAVSLINEADERIRSRNRAASTKPPEHLKGLLIKEAELTTLLNKTFTVLSSYVDDEEGVDDTLELARSLLHLTLSKPTSKSKPPTLLPQLISASFSDFLLPAETNLTLDIPSPYDLFISPIETATYSALQNYLLSIRRAHMRLSDLWRQTLLRRVHPAPLGPPASCSDFGAKVLATKCERAKRRNRSMRIVWATCSAAVFLLGEMSSYFEGEVAGEAWEHLHAWMVQEDARPTSGHVQNASTDLSTSINRLNLTRSNRASKEPPEEKQPHDPQTLTNSHIAFLKSLTRSLLLTDLPFTSSLRSLLQSIDGLVAHLHHLQSIQESRDLEEDEGIISDVMVNLETEEKECWREVTRGVSRVDTGCKAIVDRLRELDQSDDKGVGGDESGYTEEGGFVPWRGGGVERLLMRLERSGGGGEGGEDDI
ncbi:spc97 spc98 family protein [Venturia nashicola]|uniref:Spindle pole body component n=1 Tax=Venturia nashicola TaxID=86259 RepID=A0A4Z1PEI2_9PEZI|nr:spc97 spc98 family protein [Venturia nashicola]